MSPTKSIRFRCESQRYFTTYYNDRLHFFGENAFQSYCYYTLYFFPLVFGVDRKKLETALLGKRAQFQCNVQSSDASEVTLWWQFAGQNLTTTTNDEHHHSITVSKSASGAVTSELILDKVTWNDEGIYSCLAKEVGSKDEPTKQDIILDIYGEWYLSYFFYYLSFSSLHRVYTHIYG